MTLTGGEVLLAGVGALLTPAALHLIPVAGLTGVGAARPGPSRFVLAAVLGLAVTFSLIVLLRDPLIARAQPGVSWAGGLALVGLGLWRGRGASFPTVLLLAPLVGVILATMRVPIGGPRLLLLHGGAVDAGAPLARWLYHLGTGLGLAIGFGVGHLVGMRLRERLVRRGAAVAWVVMGGFVAAGGMVWLGQVLVRRLPLSTLG